MKWVEPGCDGWVVMIFLPTKKPAQGGFFIVL